jgi:hypothetical protein
MRGNGAVSPKSEQLSIRLDPAIRERLAAAAEQDRRPVWPR